MYPELQPQEKVPGRLVQSCWQLEAPEVHSLISAVRGGGPRDGAGGQEGAGGRRGTLARCGLALRPVPTRTRKNLVTFLTFSLQLFLRELVC